MKEFRIKMNIKLDAEHVGDAFAQLSTLALNRANQWEADEDFSPDPEPEFTGEIDVHPTEDELPETEFNEL
jgi:hypothetical protein